MSDSEKNTSEALDEGFQPVPPMTNSPQKQTMSRGRISFIGNVYHQIPNTQPSALAINFSRWLDSDDTQFGPRKLMVTEQWTSLDVAAGWVKQCGFLVISNLEGRFLTRVPTTEQRADINSKVVEIGLVPPPIESYGPRSMHSPPVPKFDPIPYFLIHPGEDLPVTPVDVSLLRIRCRNGSAVCNLTFYPG